MEAHRQESEMRSRRENGASQVGRTRVGRPCAGLVFQLVRRGHLAVRKYDEEYEQPDEHNPVRKAPGRSRHLRRHDGLGPT